MPTKDYIYYELILNLTIIEIIDNSDNNTNDDNNLNSNNNNENNSTFYVQLRGTTTSSTEYLTEWERIVIDNIGGQYSYLFYWLNVDTPDTLTILTYSSNSIKFDCFGINMMSDNRIINSSQFEFVCGDAGYV